MNTGSFVSSNGALLRRGYVNFMELAQREELTARVYAAPPEAKWADLAKLGSAGVSATPTSGWER